MVFEKFFENDRFNRNDSKSSDRSSGHVSQTTIGRQIASRQRDSMVDILYGGKTTDDRTYKNNFEGHKK